MKKFLKALIILLIVFVILPVALVFILFFDTGKMKVNYDDNFTKEKWTNALVVDSLDNTKKDKAMSFIVTEEDINNLIHSSIKDNAELNKYLSQLAVDITDDHYIISASGTTSGSSSSNEGNDPGTGGGEEDPGTEPVGE